jgi:arsenate reductase
MNSIIQNHCNDLITRFDTIATNRKLNLAKLAAFIQNKKDNKLPIQLVYVCTHNSRRSHFGQVWAAVAAEYYGIASVRTFSGGTEATAFNPNAIEALLNTGFQVHKEVEGSNPLYTVSFGGTHSPRCFSKVYNDSENPTENFAAIMTCSDAEENCPFIPGVEMRLAITYDDPKAFDGTPYEKEKYLERSNQIALETLYVISLVK